MFPCLRYVTVIYGQKASNNKGDIQENHDVVAVEVGVARKLTFKQISTLKDG